MKEEALKLADELDDVYSPPLQIASAMIRRLVEELDKQTYKAELLENRLKVIVGSKPLSDEEIFHIYNESYRNTLMGIDPLVFAREIEERHGIK